MAIKWAISKFRFKLRLFFCSFVYLVYSLKQPVRREWLLPLLWQRSDQYAGISSMIIIKAKIKKKKKKTKKFNRHSLRHYHRNCVWDYSASNWEIHFFWTTIVPILSIHLITLRLFTFNPIHIVYPINLLWKAKQFVYYHSTIPPIKLWDLQSQSGKLRSCLMDDANIETEEREIEESIYLFALH